MPFIENQLGHPPQTYVVYTLRDPETQEVFYVGMTSDLKARSKAHVKSAKLGLRWKVCDHIRGLLSRQLTPIVQIQEVVEDKVMACEREVYWIRHYRDKRQPLANVTIGGEGVPGCLMPDSHRRALREIMKKRWADPIYRRTHEPFLSTQRDKAVKRAAEASRRRNPWAWIENLNQLLRKRDGTTWCKVCGEIKPIGNFSGPTKGHRCDECQTIPLWKNSESAIRGRVASIRRKNPWLWLRKLRFLLRKKEELTWCNDCGILFEVDRSAKRAAVLCSLHSRARELFRYKQYRSKHLREAA